MIYIDSTDRQVRRRIADDVVGEIGCVINAPDGSSPRGYVRLCVVEHRLKCLQPSVGENGLSNARSTLPRIECGCGMAQPPSVECGCCAAQPPSVECGGRPARPP